MRTLRNLLILACVLAVLWMDFLFLWKHGGSAGRMIVTARMMRTGPYGRISPIGCFWPPFPWRWVHGNRPGLPTTARSDGRPTLLPEAPLEKVSGV